jgi:hypothetical protein
MTDPRKNYVQPGRPSVYLRLAQLMEHQADPEPEPLTIGSETSEFDWLSFSGRLAA